MTRLEKYLVATEIIEAETTVSRYFVIGNVKVRVSDHLSKMSDADLQVIIPLNGGTKLLLRIVLENFLYANKRLYCKLLRA